MVDPKSSQLRLDGGYDIRIEKILLLRLLGPASVSDWLYRGRTLHIRRPRASVASLVTTARALWYALDERTLALLALPAYDLPWFPPRAAELVHLLLGLGVTVGIDIPRIAVRPLEQLRRLARALCASDVSTLLANSGCGWDEHSLALVAGALHALFGGLMRQLVAGPRGDSEHSLFLRLLGNGLDSLFLR